MEKLSNNLTERSLGETQGNNTVLALNERAFLNPAGLPDPQTDPGTCTC